MMESKFLPTVLLFRSTIIPTVSSNNVLLPTRALPLVSQASSKKIFVWRSSEAGIFFLAFYFDRNKKKKSRQETATGKADKLLSKKMQ
jgi:hypothetical protein